MKQMGSRLKLGLRPSRVLRMPESGREREKEGDRGKDEERR